MPIYEYRCRTCGQTFEKLTSISEKDLPKICPFCGNNETIKLVSGFSSKKTYGGTCGQSSGG